MFPAHIKRVILTINECTYKVVYNTLFFHTEKDSKITEKRTRQLSIGRLAYLY